MKEKIHKHLEKEKDFDKVSLKFNLNFGFVLIFFVFIFCFQFKFAIVAARSTYINDDDSYTFNKDEITAHNSKFFLLSFFIHLLMHIPNYVFFLFF